MKNILSLIITLMMPLMASAQTITANIHTIDVDTAGVKVFFSAIGSTDDESLRPMERTADGNYENVVAESPLGFYTIVFVTGTSQLSAPVYLQGKWDKLACEVRFVDDCPRVTILPLGKKKTDKALAEEANKWQEALHDFNKVYYVKSREIWMNAQSLKEQDIRNGVKAYADAAMPLVSNTSLPADLRQYISTWAYLQGSEAVALYNRINKEKIDSRQILAVEACKVLDSPVAVLHSPALSTAVQDVPRGTLSQRLQYVSSNYKTEAMRNGIQHNILNGFIRTYKFANGYQQGLDTLLSAKERFGISEEYIDKFRERASAVPGSAFPDVKLIDVDGNSVTMEKFRGKYVYIDLWASWCVPCVKEVPYLQTLEKELQNEDVVFVSISTDSSEQPWRKKMADLNMHGNQLLNADGKLCDRLNVSGIPHFLIYDKEGHLHTYNAPRPSTGEALKQMLEKLK